MRFILLRKAEKSEDPVGSGPTPLDMLADLEGITVVESTLDQAILVEATNREALKQFAVARGWEVFPEQEFGRPERRRILPNG